MEAKILGMPQRHSANPSTIETRQRLAMIYSHRVSEIATAVAKDHRLAEKEELEQIGFLALLEDISPEIDGYVRCRIQYAMKNALDPRRRAGRAVLESRHERVEDELPVADRAASPEQLAIANQETGYLRAAIAQLPRHQAKVIQANFGGAPRKRGRLPRPDAAIRQLREHISLAQAA